MHGGGLVVKDRPENAGKVKDVGLIPGSRRSPRRGHGNPLQCSCLENPRDGGGGGGAPRDSAGSGATEEGLTSRVQVKKQQLELDMEQQTGSKLGKEYVKAVYCHPAYLTYMQSTSRETLGWKKHKLE